MYWLTLLVCGMYLWDGINEVNAKNNTSNNGNSDNTDNSIKALKKIKLTTKNSLILKGSVDDKSVSTLIHQLNKMEKKNDGARALMKELGPLSRWHQLVSQHQLQGLPGPWDPANTPTTSKKKELASSSGTRHSLAPWQAALSCLFVLC